MESRDNKEISKGKKKLITSMYLAFMLLFYLGYILLINYRGGKSEQWLITNTLTDEDVQVFQQLGFWTSILEVSILGLFVLATILLFRYRKSRKSLVRFIILHLCLFTIIFLFGYVFSFFLTSPLGDLMNLTQPLFLPAFLLVILLIYTVVIMIMGRLKHS
jgi:uncharacterized membrane protein (DUF485 family)